MKIIGYGSYGSTRGHGPFRLSLAEADGDVESDARGCARQGGYSDRQVVAVDADGCCYAVDEDGVANEDEWIPGPGGLTSGAARYDLASIDNLMARAM